MVAEPASLSPGDGSGRRQMPMPFRRSLFLSLSCLRESPFLRCGFTCRVEPELSDGRATGGAVTLLSY